MNSKLAKNGSSPMAVERPLATNPLLQSQLEPIQFDEGAKAPLFSESSELDASTVVSVLGRLNPELEIVSVTEGIIELKNPAPASLPELPPGYGFKGGMARYALRAALGLSAGDPYPRDLDIVSVGRTDPATDHQVAIDFMPDDLAHGYGVEPVSHVAEYLSSRDLTINEVLAVGDSIYLSYQCLQDTIDQTLRATEYETSPEGAVNGKIAMKMVRLAAEAQFRGEEWSLEGLEDLSRVGAFDIALHLDRALEKGQQVAGIYVETVMELNVLWLEPSPYESLDETIHYLADQLYEGLDFFRHLPYRIKYELADELGHDPDCETCWMDEYDAYVYQQGKGRRQATKNLPK